jgi:flagellar biogenesis protein FliO
MRMIVLALLALLLASHCFAQTPTPGQSVPAPSRISAPAATPLPAIEGAYEHDPVRQSGKTSATSTDGKLASSPNSSEGPLDFRRVAISLAIVLALVFICRWAARYLFPSAAVGRSSQVMKVLSRLVIAPKQQLLLIQFGRRLVLIGDSGQQMNSLAEISDPDEVASVLGQLSAGSASATAGEAANPFAPLLGRAQRQFDQIPVPPAVEPDEDEGEVAATGVDATRNELSGLTDKIRMLSRQLGKT